ncbi:MAG: hypothetical protein ACLGIS_11090, partial [Actinomycetes bacterium]
PLIGSVVERNGLGRTLSAEAAPETISKTINDILTDPAILDATARTGERLRSQDGARKGADCIERIGYRP